MSEKYNFIKLAEFLSKEKFLQKSADKAYQEILGYGTLTTLFDLYSNGYINNASLGYTDIIKLSEILKKANEKNPTSMETLLFNVFQSHSSIKFKLVNEDFDRNYGVKHLLRDYLNGEIDEIDTIFNNGYKIDIYGNIVSKANNLDHGNLTPTQIHRLVSIMNMAENTTTRALIKQLDNIRDTNNSKYQQYITKLLRLENKDKSNL